MHASGLTLGKRIALLAVVGPAVALSLVGYLALTSLQESTQRALNERLVAAQLTSRHIDNYLALYINSLADAGATANLDLHDADLGPETMLLRRLRGTDSYAPGLFLLDQNQRTIWSEPEGAADASPPELATAERAMAGRRPQVSDAFQDGHSTQLVALAVPLGSEPEGPHGALVAVLDLSGPLLSAFVQPVSLGKTGYAEIVDSQGLVLASSNPSRLFQKSDHTDQFADMIRSGRPTVGGCHDCHEAGGESKVAPGIIAFAPLSMAPWGVAIRQSEQEVLGPTWELRGSLAAASSLSLLAVALLAWFTAGSVARPLRELIAASRRIAGGDLESGIAPTGPAEIGELARAFDEMRERLRTSLGKLEQVNAELEARVQQRTKQLSALLDKAISAQEEERRRIARELHDDTCQSLAALVISLEDAEESLPEFATASRAILTRLKGRMRETLAGVRTLALNLRPSVLDDLGLVMAVDWYAREQLGSRGLLFDLATDGFPRELPPHLETVLFRIAQEALNNVVRHSRAKKVVARLNADESKVVLEVEDDGIGFDPERVLSPGSPRQSLGMRGMIERASISGGTLRIETSPGAGTLIRVELPLWIEGGRYEQDKGAGSGRPQDPAGRDTESAGKSPGHGGDRGGIGGRRGGGEDAAVVAGRGADGHHDAGDEWA